jgi:hypothetical protein
MLLASGRWTVSGCQLRVIEGRIQDYTPDTGTVIVLPCNEYCDDRWQEIRRARLGHMSTARSRASGMEAFVSLLQGECNRSFGAGHME